jgi:large subunit ribosomal protein L30
MEALRSSIPKGGFFRIKLLRSAIGLPKRYRGVLEALGLKRRLGVVYQPVSRDIAGMIMKVKELVDVEEVDERRTKGEIAQSRRPERGYVVEKKASDDVVQTERTV